MTRDTESNASVRIEVDSFGGAEAPPVFSAVASSPNGGRDRSTVLAIGALVVAVLIIGALVFMLAPESGTTAAGTPVMSPTTTPSTTLDSSGSSAASASTEAQTDEPVIVGHPKQADGFETAELDFFPIEVVQAELGWFAFGWQRTTIASPFGLFRSVDGLNWSQLDTSSAPSGDILGFAIVDGTFLLAVDEEQSWTRQAQSQSQSPEELLSEPFNVTFWESSDAATWSPSPERDAISGTGLPYPVVMTGEGAFATVFELSVDDSALVEYLAPIMEADVARQVCRATVTFTTTSDAQSGSSYLFTDCDGKELVTIPVSDMNELDAPDDGGLQLCVQYLRDQGSRRGVLTVSLLDGSSHRTEMGSSFPLVGTVIGSVFLAAVPPSGWNPPCGQATEQPELGSLFRWSADDGATFVELPGSAAAYVQSPISLRSDGDAIVVTEGGIALLSPPYTEAELVAHPFPTLDEADEFVSGATLSVSLGGQLLMAQKANSWLFGEPGTTDWYELEVNNSDFAFILLATDEYAIVQVQQGDTNTVVKVPLP